MYIYIFLYIYSILYSKTSLREITARTTIVLHISNCLLFGYWTGKGVLGVPQVPITTHHEDRYVLETICKSLKLPNGEWCGPDGSHHVYYTDGSCKHPAFHEARLSAWSVIRDFAVDSDHAREMTKNCLALGQPCPLLRCVDMGLTPGVQSISRAELAAVIVACETASADKTMEHADI